MNPVKYSVLVLFQLVHADSAIQTDWSGGDNILGPVCEWSNEFNQSSCVNWYDDTGSLLLLQGIVKHTIDGDFEGAWSVYSEDIDGDGDMDALGTAVFALEITWWGSTECSTSGELVSNILYLCNDPGFGAIDWSASTSSGTSVSFLVRASDDYGNMGVRSDTFEIPCSLNSILNDHDSYFQYKVILETVNPETAIPSLHDVTLSWNPLGIEETVEPIPAGTELLPITPNPSAGSTIIRFGLTESVSVEISIFDLSGRLVREIRKDEYCPGFHDVLVGNLSSGIFFCRMTSGKFTATQCFVVVE